MDNNGTVNKDKNNLSYLALLLQIATAISMFIFILLSLILLQLTSKVDVDSVILSRINTSKQIVMIDAFNKDMPNINNKVTKTMIKYFIETTFSLYYEEEEIERKFQPMKEVYFLSTIQVWEEINKFMRPYIDRVIGSTGNITTSVNIIEMNNLASNLWQTYFDLRLYNAASGKLEIQRFVLNTRIGYYPARVVMAKTFTNPLGFAVTEFNIARVKK